MSLEVEPRRTVSSQMVFGLALLAIGLILLFGNLGIIDVRWILRYWPVALIAVGLVKLTQARGAPGLLAASVWLAAGGILLSNRLGYSSLGIGDLWPVFLVLMGVSLLLRREGWRGRSVDVDQDHTISGFTIMGGIERKMATQQFEGGDLSAIMGGIEVDLTRASIAEGKATVDVFALWGGIELKVPEDWTVVSKVFPLMAGYEDKTRPPELRNKVLTVRGIVVMGGIEVRN